MDGKRAKRVRHPWELRRDPPAPLAKLSLRACADQPSKGNRMGDPCFAGARHPLWIADRRGHQVRILTRLMRYLFEAGVEVDGTLVYTLLFQNEIEMRSWVSEKCARMEAAGWARRTKAGV